MSKLFIGVVLFTLVEFLGVDRWEALAPTQKLLAVLVLYLGFLVEHVISSRVRTGGVRLGPVVVVAVVETVTWVGWRALVPVEPIAAVVVFAVGLHVGHALESNLLAGRRLLAQLGTQLIDVVNIVTTVIETVTGVLWLGLLGRGAVVVARGVLAAGLLIEHSVATFARVRR